MLSASASLLGAASTQTAAHAAGTHAVVNRATGVNAPAAPRYEATLAHSRHGVLRLIVKRLPRGLRARITVSGPSHFHRHLTGSASLVLPAGTYTVSAAKLPRAGSTYFATVSARRVQVRSGHTRVIAVSYGTRIPRSTRVVPASATVSLAGEWGDARVLTVKGAIAHSIAVGQYLASGVTAGAPDGYLVKVTGVSESGGEAVLQVRDATLLEAVPQGEIDTTRTLSQPAQAGSARQGGGPHAHAAALSLKAANLSCQTSAGVHIEDPNVSFSPSISLVAHWGFFKLDSATLSATVAASLSMGASADAGASCATEEPGIGLLSKPVKLPTIEVQVGPIPVVIEPELQVYLFGEAKISAKASVSLSASASATVGVTYEHGGFHPFDSFPAHFGKSFTTEGDANAEIALRPTVDTLVYGVAGPSFDIGAAAKFEADVNASPWWTLQGCLQAGIGFTFDLLKIDWSDPHLLQACKALLSASTPAPKPPPSSSVAGGAPPGGNITFVGSPGTEAPPETLGGYTMQPVPDSLTAEPGEDVTEIGGPTGTISFDSPLTYFRVAEGWETWSNEYTGAVYVSGSDPEGFATTTVQLPPNTGAFYLYAEPDEFENFSLTATTQDGTTSGPTTVFGETGARYFGFYAACGARITSIQVSDGEFDPELGIGELGIAAAKPGC